MLNRDKDRVSDETLVYTPASGFGRSGPSQFGPREGILFVRLWSAAGKRLDCRPTRHSGPLLNLVLDVIRSSAGTQEAGSAEFVSARFPDIFSGLQCGRRIQWTVEGLTEHESFRSAAAAILIDAGDSSHQHQGPSGQDWEAATPGKILLKSSVCEVLEGVPGVSLEGITAGGWRNWSWKAIEPDTSFSADEQVVGRIIQADGRIDPGTVALSTAQTPARSTSASPAAANRPTAASSSTDIDDGAAKHSSLLRIPMVAGAVGVLLIAVVLIFLLTRKTTVQSATPGAVSGSSPASVSGSQPAQNTPHASSPSTVAPPVVAERPAQTPASSKHARDKKAAVPELKPAPAPVIVHCDLTEEDIQRSLARADRYMHAGDLADARAAYQHVLGCPSARERAQEGLNRIQRMAAQNGSPGSS